MGERKKYDIDVCVWLEYADSEVCHTSCFGTHRITVVHGIAHQPLVGAISWFQYSYVLLVTLAAPIAATAMLFLKNSNFQRGGVWLLIASMSESFLFKVFYHMLVPASDDIFTVMHGPVDCDTSCNSRRRRLLDRN